MQKWTKTSIKIMNRICTRTICRWVVKPQRYEKCYKSILWTFTYLYNTFILLFIVSVHVATSEIVSYKRSLWYISWRELSLLDQRCVKHSPSGRSWPSRLFHKMEKKRNPKNSKLTQLSPNQQRMGSQVKPEKNRSVIFN